MAPSSSRSKRRVNELRGLGYGDNTIGAQISKDINQLFDAAEMIGMNPAQLAYMRAQEAMFPLVAFGVVAVFVWLGVRSEKRAARHLYKFFTVGRTPAHRG